MQKIVIIGNITLALLHAAHTACPETSIVQIMHMPPQEDLVLGPMGIMRPVKEEDVAERMKREHEELLVAPPNGTLAYVLGSFVSFARTTRFAIARELRAQKEMPPIVSPQETPEEINEAFRKFGESERAAIFMGESEFDRHKVQLIGGKDKAEKAKLFIAFLKVCVTYNASMLL